MTVDLRTRRDSEQRVVDADAFFGHDLPWLLGMHRDLVPPADELELRPFVVRVGDGAWLLRRSDDSFDVSTINDAAIDDLAASERIIEVRLTAQQLSDLVNDQVTPIGLMTAGSLDQARGRIGRLLDWWLVWRSVLDGIPVHRHGAVTLPADLGRSFTLDDDPQDILDYLESAGYLHLRGVFSIEEMERVSADMDTAAPRYEPGDGHSWWATLADGTEQVVRMQQFERHSATVAALIADPRFLRIAELARAGHIVDEESDDRVEALFKPIGVVSGISDVPWHKDCSLGRHSYRCCSLTVGISVTGGGPTSGQLRVVAGSHRALVWPSLLDVTDLDLPDVALPTETGDVTVHLSCTLHMAQAPTASPRRVLYTDFRLPAHDTDAARAADRRLYEESREAAPQNTTQVSTV